MKKIIFTLTVCIVTMLVACGQGKYDEVIEYNNQFVEITKNYISGLDTAQSADDVVKAMNAYTEKFEKLIPKMQEINEKYPNLMNEKELPEKLIQSQAEATQVGMDFAKSFMKSMQYITDPKVAKAQQDMGRVMQSLKK